MSIFYNVNQLDSSLTSSVFNKLVDLIKDHKQLSLEIPEQLVTITTTLQELYENLKQHEMYDVIKNNELDIDDVDNLLNLLQKSGLLGDGNMEKLLTPVSEFSDGFDWPLVEIEPQTNSGNVGVFAFASNFSLEAQLSAQYRGRVDTLVNKLPSPNSLMEYSLQGKGALSGDISLNLTKGALGLSVDAGLSSEIDGKISIFSHAEPNNSLLFTAYKHLNDIDDIPGLDAFRRGSVKAISHRFNGEIKAWANAELGYSWEISETTSRSSPKLVGAQVGIGGGVSWKLVGNIEVTAYIADQNTLVLEANKTREQHVGNEFYISATLETEGVKDYAKKYLDEIADFDTKVQDILDEFGEPKKKLLSLLNEKLTSRPEWQTILVELVTGQSNAENVKKQLEEKLSAKLKQPFENIEDLINDPEKIEPLAVELATFVGQENSQAAISYLQSLVQDTVSDWYNGYVDKVKDLVADEADQHVLKQLEEYGDKVDGKLDSANDKVNFYLNAFKNLRKNYLQKLQLMTDFVNTTMVEEIGLNYKRSQQKIDTDSALFKVEFKLDTDDQSRLKVAQWFGQCLCGDFSQVLHYADTNPGNQLFTIKESLISTATENTISASLSINLFGLKASRQTIMNTKAILQYDGQGNISVYQGDNEYKAIKKSGNESQTASFNNVLNLISPNESSINISVNYRDADLTSNELAGFVNLFQQVNLVANKSVEKLDAALSKRKFINANKDNTIVINNRLSITSSEIDVALTKEDKDVFNTAVQMQCQSWRAYLTLNSNFVLQVILKSIQATNNKVSLHEAAIALIDLSKGQQRSALKRALHIVYKKCEPRLRAGYVREICRFLNKLATNANELNELLSVLREIKQIDVPDDSVSESDVSQYKEELSNNLQEINQTLDDWVKPAKSIFQHKMDSTHPNTVALILSLRELCESNENIIPLVYHAEENQMPEPIIVV